MSTLATLSVLLCCTPFIFSTQLLDELPVSEDGKLSYSGVVTMDGLTRRELHRRAKTSLAGLSVLTDDEDAGLFVVQGFRGVRIRKSASTSIPFQMLYTIRIQTRDGRFRFEVTDIAFQNHPGRYYPSIVTPAEEAFAKRNYFRRNGAIARTYGKLKCEMEAAIPEIINEIKRAMTRPVNLPNVNW